MCERMKIRTGWQPQKWTGRGNSTRKCGKQEQMGLLVERRKVHESELLEPGPRPREALLETGPRGLCLPEAKMSSYLDILS